MSFDVLDHAAELREKANANLEPELMTTERTRRARVRRPYQEARGLRQALLARRVSDARELARMTGTSVGRARETVETGQRLASAPTVEGAFKSGAISLDHAAEIAKAEEARPGSEAGPPAVTENPASLSRPTLYQRSPARQSQVRSP